MLQIRNSAWLPPVSDDPKYLLVLSLGSLAESSETSLRGAQILDDDGAIADNAAKNPLITARAEAVEILQPVCRVHGTANR